MSVNNGNKRRALKKSSARNRFNERFGAPIESFSSFKRATEGLANGTTIKDYRNVLAAFFVWLNENPDQVIVNRQNDIKGADLLNVERYERQVKVYIKELEKKGLNVQPYLNRIQGFFSNNSSRIRLDMGNLKISTDTKKIKYTPCVDDVKLLNSYADSARDHFIVTVAFQNGVLPVDLAALRIGEYPEEAWVYYKKKRSKTAKTWHGCSTPDACMYLKAYLLLRKGRGGEPLLVGREGALDGESISRIIRDLIERSGLDKIPQFIPKCLRDGFSGALTDAEIDHKTKEAMMGHDSIEQKYDSARANEQVIKAMKKVYPLVCLNEVNLNVKAGGFSVEQTERLNVLLSKFDRFMEIADMIERGELVKKDVEKT